MTVMSKLKIRIQILKNNNDDEFSAQHTDYP